MCVFLDSRCLIPGDGWDTALAAAQRASRITIVLVSSRTGEAYYEREEVAAALAMARKAKELHRGCRCTSTHRPAKTCLTVWGSNTA